MASNKNTPALIASIALGFALSQASAQVLMLDFGGNNPSNQVSSNNTSSPYHTDTGSVADFTWNSIATSGSVASGLVWSDATAATGIATIGYKFSGGQTVTSGTGWQTIFNGSASGAVNTGIYAQGNAAYDGGMTSSGFATDDRAVGLQVNGLAVGTYAVYISGRYTNYEGATDYTQTFYAGVGASSGNFNFITGGYASDSTTFTADNTSKTSEWVYDAGDAASSNYVKLTVSITSLGQALNIAAQGSGTFNGFLNTVQIVAIPEPSAFALIGGTAGLLLAVGLSRRRHG
ncbi:MAG: hypothetical protein ABII82_01430 [Verrucomicrobiota bacterium]